MAAAAVALAIPGWAHATAPSDLCTGNPCNVTASITVDPNSDLDFGDGTQLVLKATAIVTLGGSGPRSLTMRAGSIVMEPGARILGNGDGAQITLQATMGNLVLQSSGATLSRIVVASDNAGGIDLSASGNIDVSGLLDATSTSDDSVGGSISITAGGTVAINRDIDFDATGSFASGGDLTVSAGTGATVNGILDGTGVGDGGSVDVSTTTGDLVVNKKIDVSGGAPEGLGGSIDLTATAGNVLVNGPLVGTGGTGAEEACGDGAEVDITAGLAVTLSQPMSLTAGTQCFGGSVTIVAGTTFTQQTGADIVARGPGSFGGGGFFTLQTGGDATIRNVDLGSPGVGGFSDIRASSGTLSFQGAINMQGTGTFGIGGAADVTGCTVVVASTGKIDTRGNFAIPQTGQNVVRASGSMNIAGQLLALSKNELRVKSGAPTITGTVTPAAMIIVDDTLPTCIQLAACGNGVVEAPEVCDDDNTASCDGCKNDCTRADDVCGDGIAECGEQCDDGNDVDDDGCKNDCTLPGSEGVRFAGSLLQPAGCLAEWELNIDDPKIKSNGFPDISQTCVDGDSTCDFDEQNNDQCIFHARICLRVPDPRLLGCTPESIASVTLRGPDSLTTGAANDRANAKAITDALKALGGTVKLGTQTLQSGPALAAFDNCTTPFELLVPHAPSSLGRELFNIRADDTNGLIMSSNQMRLQCAVNTSVCGNGVTEPTEQCDDGNNNACDGCSPTCRSEFCGDGIVQCSEQCDEGLANGTPGSRCNTQCQELPPELRIPGGGSKVLDCLSEFSAELNPAQVALDQKDLPKTQQRCVDNDPECDLDPTAGTCRIRVWECLGGGDGRFGCAAAPVLERQVLTPNARATGSPLAARNALSQALNALPFPAGPGEACTTRFDVDVPVGPRGLTLKTKVKLSGSNKADTDALKLRCVSPPAP